MKIKKLSSKFQKNKLNLIIAIKFEFKNKKQINL